MGRTSKAIVHQRMVSILKAMKDGVNYTGKQLAEVSKIHFKYVRTLLHGMKIIGLIEEAGLTPHPTRKSSFRKLWRKKNKFFYPHWVRMRL